LTVATVTRPGALTRIIEGYDEETGTWPQTTTNAPVVRLFAALRTGATLRGAASYADSSKETITRWLEHAEVIVTASGIDVEDPEARASLEVGDRVFVDFAVQLAKTYGQFEVEFANVVRRGAQEDPKLALILLARRVPEWREQRGVDVTSGGEPVVQDRIAELLKKDPKVAVAGEALTMALAAAAGESFDADDDD
jgi:hypothetical protein